MLASKAIENSRLRFLMCNEARVGLKHTVLAKRKFRKCNARGTPSQYLGETDLPHTWFKLWVIHLPLHSWCFGRKCDTHGLAMIA